MTDNVMRYFTLESSLAAVSAVMLGGSTLATDGVSPFIFEFDLNGNQTACHKTERPYIRLRAVEGGFTATGGCGGQRVYFLNSQFNELDSVLLGEPCHRQAYNNHTGCLTDATLTRLGSESFIIGSFEKSAYLFDTCGCRLTKLCTADTGELLTDFVPLGDGTYAMATKNSCGQSVTVSDGKSTQTASILNGYTLRMLIPSGNELFGLFGKSYIYNRIIKIYSCNTLLLPNGCGAFFG